MGRLGEDHGTERARESHKQRQRSKERDGNQHDMKSRGRSYSPAHDFRRHRRRYSSDEQPSQARRSAKEERVRSRSRSPPPKRRRHEKGESRHSGYPHRSRKRSDSPPTRRRNHSRSPRRESLPLSKRSNAPLPSQTDAFAGNSVAPIKSGSPPPEKVKPNYAPSGLLAAETNTVANTSIVLKYNEPPESRLPPASQPWRLYIFKDSSILETLSLHTRTCWLFGREKAVVDHATEHPSCSKQHAVLQFRYSEKRDEWGERKGRVRLYVIDLESANGTSVNGERIDDRRFVEVKSGDVVRFGESTREYVVLLPPKDGKDGMDVS